MGRQTPLFDLHTRLGARMVDFGGWDMPVHYGSQIEEHHAVRRNAGVFDVSHMCVIDLRGEHVRDLLLKLLANDVAKVRVPGKALYSCLLNETAGVIDDLIVYHFEEQFFRLIVNAGTRDKDLAWIRPHAAKLGVEVTERVDLAILAVQGPTSRTIVETLLPRPEGRGPVMKLAPFSGRVNGSWFVARTGYTGEDGFEIVLPATEAEALWLALNERGVASCGLGARDTLRLEAGLNLYGNDMDESINPLESGLGWTVAFDPEERAFIGRPALEAIRSRGNLRRFVGLVLEDRGVLRSHQKVIVEGIGEGEVTSGTFSPTLQRSIGLARVPAGTGERVQVDIRGKLAAARIVRPPFVRHGKSLIS